MKCDAGYNFVVAYNKDDVYIMRYLKNAKVGFLKFKKDDIKSIKAGLN
jgi:hypothetical protein